MNKIKIAIVFFVIYSFPSLAQERTYRIKKGESLSDVARKFGIEYEILIRENQNVSRWPKENTIIHLPLGRDQGMEIEYPMDPMPGRKRKEDAIEKSETSFIMHSVQSKETLYGVSKKYGISVSDLMESNPILSKEGLKEGQHLQIVLPKKEKKTAETFKTIEKEERIHTVKLEETWYGISEFYSVPVSDLQKLNSEIVSRGLKTGDFIKIPEIKISIPKDVHVVTKGETMYSISKLYGLEVDDLLIANDTVLVEGLSIGILLKLPKTKGKRFSNEVIREGLFYDREPIIYPFRVGQETLDIVLKNHDLSLDSLKFFNPRLDFILSKGGDLIVGFKKMNRLFTDRIQESRIFQDSTKKNAFLKLICMLPFNFKKNDTLSANILFSNPNSLTNIVGDFYLGAEIALDSLKNQGLKLDFHMIDTEGKIDVIYEEIEQINKIQPDLIIGPLYSSIAMYVASRFPSVPLFYPIYSRKQNFFVSKNIIRTRTDKDLLQKKIIAYIKENRDGRNLIILGKDAEKLELFMENLLEKDSLGNYLEQNISLISMEKEDYISKEVFLEKLKLNTSNWILIADQDNLIVSDVFNNIINLPEESKNTTPIRVFSFEKLDYAEKIPFELLIKYKYTYATDVLEYLDLKDDLFEASYLSRNSSYPSDYAKVGFDIVYDAVLRVLKKGSDSQIPLNPSHRSRMVFLYENLPIVTNTSVFINLIENDPKDGLKIVRLR